MREATVQVARRVGLRECGLERAETKALAREEEFAGLVERQSRFAFRVAHALLRNAADSEDAVQDVFLKLYRNGSWRQVDDERAFLARATWRVAATRLRKRRGYVAVQEVARTAELNPEAGAISEGGMAAVYRIIDSLPEELRQPLALSALQELNSREIAGVMGIPEGTVRTRLARARQLVKQKLETIQGSGHAK